MIKKSQNLLDKKKLLSNQTNKALFFDIHSVYYYTFCEILWFLFYRVYSQNDEDWKIMSKNSDYDDKYNLWPLSS